MTKTIKPPYQLIEFTGGGLILGGYAQLKGYRPAIAPLYSKGGIRLGGRASTLAPVSTIGGLRLGGRSSVLSRIGEYSPAIARFGATVGMTEVVNSPNSQGTQYLPDIGFPFPIYGSTYKSNIAISSQWALLFGFSSLAASDISRTVPGRAFLIAASRLRSWDRVQVKSDNAFSYRVRFESTISTTQRTKFEVTLYSDGAIQLVCGTDFDFYGFFGQTRVRSITKGDNVSYTDFDLPYPYSAETDSANAGVAISFVFTPDDTAGNTHTVRVGSYPKTAPKIAIGGLRLGGRSDVDPSAVTYTKIAIGGLRLGGMASRVLSESFGGLRLGGRADVGTAIYPKDAIGGLKLGGRSNVGSTPQAETTAWKNRVIALGGTTTIAAESAVDAFFVAIKPTTYWSKLKLLHLFAGTSTISSAMAPLKHPSGTAATNSGFGAGSYTNTGSSAGIQGDGSNYIDHNYSLYANSPGSSAAIGTYSKTDGGYDVYDVGHVVNSNASLEISMRWSNGNFYADIFDAINGRVSASSPGGAGFGIVSRTSETDARYYFNGTQYGINTTTVDPMPSALNSFYSFAGGSGFGVSPRKLVFSFASDGITPTEVSSFTSAVSTLIGAI